MALQIGVGDETTSIERRAETAPGTWEVVGADEVELRELYWRRLAAGQGGILGGQFTAEGGKRFAVPGPEYGWVYMEHDYPDPVTLRYIIVPEEEGAPGAIYLWNPGESGGLSVVGGLQDFKRSRKRSGTNGHLTIGWEFPDTADRVENAPSGHLPLSVHFTPGPGDAKMLLSPEVQAEYDKKRGGK